MLWAIRLWVGALAGLSYVEQLSPQDYNNLYTTIVNCVVSGYTVAYDQQNPNANVAIGGLVGYNWNNTKAS